MAYANARNPAGGKPDKLMRDALIVELKREAIASDGTVTIKLRKVAAKLVDEAIDGNVAAIREINERVDGKVPQAVVGDDGSPPVMLEAVVRTIIDPKLIEGEVTEVEPKEKEPT